MVQTSKLDTKMSDLPSHFAIIFSEKMLCIRRVNIVEEREICLGFPVELGNKWFVLSNIDYCCSYPISFLQLSMELNASVFMVKEKQSQRRGFGGRGQRYDSMAFTGRVPTTGVASCNMFIYVSRAFEKFMLEGSFRMICNFCAHILVSTCEELDEVCFGCYILFSRTVIVYGFLESLFSAYTKIV